MKPVLLTGANGFMGRRIARRLLDEGYAVIGLDLAPAAAAPFTRYVGVDLLKDDLDADLFDGDTTIVHAAAIIPGDALGSYREEDDPNVQMTLNILNACARHDVRRFVQIGSASVYGPGESARREDHALEPVSAYGKGKLACERAIERCARDSGLSAIILRKGSVFGEGMPASNSSARMIGAIAAGKFFVPGNGLNLKSFLHVDEAVSVVAASVDSLAPAPEAGISVLNAASQPVTVGAVADAVADAIDARRPVRVPTAVLKPGQLLADRSGIRSLQNLSGSIRKLASTDFLDCTRIREFFPGVITGNAPEQMATVAIAQCKR